MLEKKIAVVWSVQTQKSKIWEVQKLTKIEAAGRSEGRDRDRFKGNSETESLKRPELGGLGRGDGEGRAGAAAAAAPPLPLQSMDY